MGFPPAPRPLAQKGIVGIWQIRLSQAGPARLILSDRRISRCWYVQPTVNRETLRMKDRPRRTKVIGVRLLEEEFTRLEALAEREGVLPTETARRLLLEAIERAEAQAKDQGPGANG